MSELPISCKWWRYPVAPETRTLDYTKLRAKDRARYPVMQFTKPARATYVCEKAKEGRRDNLQAKRDARRVDRPSKRPRRDEARKLVLPGTWTFHGADKPYSERWTFTPKPQRIAKKLPLRLKPLGERVRNLPAWRGPVQFKWKPDRQHYFGGWEQNKCVPRTTLPRPSMANMRDFVTQTCFFCIE